jgi:hypothetical protein
MVAVTVTVPAAVVFRVFPLIVAPVVPALLTVHVMLLLVASMGETEPVRVRGVLAVPAVGTSVIIKTGQMITMTKSRVKAVPCAVPFAMVALTVIFPAPLLLLIKVFPSIDAGLGLVYPTIVHTIVLLVALAGATVPVRVRGVLAVPAVGTPVMPVTATNALPSSGLLPP